MDKGQKSSPCGKVITLEPGDDIRIKSRGRAPEGYCGISLFTPDQVNNYTCDAICVTFKTASIGVCNAKLKIVGHTFGQSGDLVRVRGVSVFLEDLS